MAVDQLSLADSRSYYSRSTARQSTTLLKGLEDSMATGERNQRTMQTSIEASEQTSRGRRVVLTNTTVGSARFNPTVTMNIQETGEMEGREQRRKQLFQARLSQISNTNVDERLSLRNNRGVMYTATGKDKSVENSSDW